MTIRLMKKSNFKTLIPFFTAFLSLVLMSPRVRAADNFALVELYTSEGCSSCPPADLLLSRIADVARRDGKPVYLLGFHVDYWNHLGWPDRFSRADFTRRQRLYAGVHKSTTIYTPQMIVNGRESFSGYRQDLAQQAIEQNLRRPADAGVHFDVFAGKEGWKVVYQLSGEWAGKTLNAALVERGLQTKVERGENAGRLLRHDNVVRTFYSAQVSGDMGEFQLDVPQDLAAANAAVILYIQDPDTMVINGAAQKNGP